MMDTSKLEPSGNLSRHRTRVDDPATRGRRSWRIGRGVSSLGFVALALLAVACSDGDDGVNPSPGEASDASNDHVGSGGRPSASDAASAGDAAGAGGSSAGSNDASQSDGAAQSDTGAGGAGGATAAGDAGTGGGAASGDAGTGGGAAAGAAGTGGGAAAGAAGTGGASAIDGGAGGSVGATDASIDASDGAAGGSVGATDGGAPSDATSTVDALDEGTADGSSAPQDDASASDASTLIDASPDAGGDASEGGAPGEHPNILYIMADDLGYSDIHAFGGEIDTPNLDALVESGRILTNHHAGTVSAITRAMLISGTDHHLVGEGTMGAPNDERAGLPGYEGYLNSSSLSFAQLLRDAGYHTYIAGKWHLGSGLVGSAGGHTPDQWGFERSYTLLGGAANNHFGHEPANSRNYTEDGVYVQPGQPGQPGGTGGSPAVFYSTDFYTQKLIDYIDSNHGDGKPFFAYAAYTSPHWPLQVPDPWLSKYKGKYDQGYDVIRAVRIARLQDKGLLPVNVNPYPGQPETLTQPPASANNGTASARYISAVHSPADGYVDYHAGLVNKRWDSLSAAEKKAQARYMEIYAGMVSNLDDNIGKLIQHLKDIGEYDRTFILFQSDNGAEGWPIDSGADPKATDEANAASGVFETLGSDNGIAAAKRLQYGLRWAEVSATPFAFNKGTLAEGGVRVPAIVHLPGQAARLSNLDALTHVTDNTATFLALAGVTPPSSPAPSAVDPDSGVDKNHGKVLYAGRAVYPVTGRSLLPLLSGQSASVRVEPLGDESYGRAYIFSADGHWKARWLEPPFGPQDGRWELFDIQEDPGETTDLSSSQPSLVTTLLGQWSSYMTSVGGVEPLRPRGYY